MYPLCIYIHVCVNRHIHICILEIYHVRKCVHTHIYIHETFSPVINI